MARLFSIFMTAVCLAIVPQIAMAAEPSLSPPVSCANGLIGGINCIPTKKDLQDSREAFNHGVKLHKKQRLEEAFVQFDEAASLNPQNVEYLAAREAVKAKLVFQHIESGNLLLLQDARLRAAAEFKAAVDLTLRTNSRASDCRKPRGSSTGTEQRDVIARPCRQKSICSQLKVAPRSTSAETRIPYSLNLPRLTRSECNSTTLFLRGRWCSM